MLLFDQFTILVLDIRYLDNKVNKIRFIFLFGIILLHLFKQLFTFDLHFMNSYKINLLFDQMFMVNVLSWLAFLFIYVRIVY